MQVFKKDNKQRKIRPNTKNPQYRILDMNKSWGKSKPTVWQRAESRARSGRKLFRKPHPKPDWEFNKFRVGLWKGWAERNQARSWTRWGRIWLKIIAVCWKGIMISPNTGKTYKAVCIWALKLSKQPHPKTTPSSMACLIKDLLD